MNEFENAIVSPVLDNYNVNALFKIDSISTSSLHMRSNISIRNETNLYCTAPLVNWGFKTSAVLHSSCKNTYFFQKCKTVLTQMSMHAYILIWVRVCVTRMCSFIHFAYIHVFMYLLWPHILYTVELGKTLNIYNVVAMLLIAR